jgi:hypothetical protein
VRRQTPRWPLAHGSFNSSLADLFFYGILTNPLVDFKVERTMIVAWKVKTTPREIAVEALQQNSFGTHKR